MSVHWDRSVQDSYLLRKHTDKSSVRRLSRQDCNALCLLVTITEQIHQRKKFEALRTYQPLASHSTPSLTLSKSVDCNFCACRCTASILILFFKRFHMKGFKNRKTLKWLSFSPNMRSCILHAVTRVSDALEWVDGAHRKKKKSLKKLSFFIKHA